MYAVIDGVGRLRAASTGADEGDTIACMVVECDDVRVGFVLNKNAMGPATGVRAADCYVMCWRMRSILLRMCRGQRRRIYTMRFVYGKNSERLGEPKDVLRWILPSQGIWA